MIDQKMEGYFADWARREEVAESMVPLIGKLYRDFGVVTTIYGRSLVHGSTIDILKAHRFARQVIKDELCMSSSFAGPPGPVPDGSGPDADRCRQVDYQVPGGGSEGGRGRFPAPGTG